jgi:hypothetical protein
MYNFKNTVVARARITKNTQSLLDIVVINKENHTNPGSVLDVGLSYHQTQILWINSEKSKKWYTESQERRVH